jgi:hypothetical protein
LGQYRPQVFIAVGCLSTFFYRRSHYSRDSFPPMQEVSEAMRETACLVWWAISIFLRTGRGVKSLLCSLAVLDTTIQS